MSHTNENTVNLLSNAANNVDAISSYNELRKGLVKHLKQKGLDWKVGQTNRRTELLHKTLLVLEDVKSPQLINLDLIYNIAECLYSKRQNTEAANIEVNEDVQQLVDNYSDFIVERYEVKQLFKTIDQKSVNTLKNVFILQQEVNKDTVKEALGKLLAAKGIHQQSSYLKRH